jgi:hypothetical protein
MALFRVWAAQKHEAPKVETIIEASSAHAAIVEVARNPETVRVFGGVLPLFGAELVYSMDNMESVIQNLSNPLQAV